MTRARWRALTASPTLTTWGNLSVRALELMVVLPLGFRHLTSADSAIWLLIFSIPRVFQLLELGFGITVVRAVAQSRHPSSSGLPVADFTVDRAWPVIRWTYLRLSFLVGSLTLMLGSMALVVPISRSGSPEDAWLAWLLAVLGSSVATYSLGYANFLLGLEEVARVRWWDSFGVAVGTVLTLVAIQTEAGLPSLVGARAVGIVATAFALRGLLQSRNRVMSRGPLAAGSISVRDLAPLWPATWRSVLGVLMSVGILEAGGVVYAQFAGPAETTAYLFATRLLQGLVLFANAPFYSWLPSYARLYSEGRLGELVALAAIGMRRTLWFFALGYGALAVVGPAFFSWIGTQTPFPDAALWGLLGFSFFVERIGALHLQLYSTTNDIRWHTASGIYGSVVLVTTALLAPRLGVYSIPAGWLGGSCGFYLWYCAALSYRRFSLRFWDFERHTSLAPFAFVLIVCITLLV